MISVYYVVAVAIAVAIIIILVIAMCRQRSNLIVWITDPREFSKFPGFADYFSGFSRCDVVARTPLKCATADQYLSQLTLKPPTDSDALSSVSRAVLAAQNSIRNASPDSLAQKIKVSVGTAVRILSLLNDPSVSWKIAVFDDLAENGWPHTHGDVTCIPRSFASKIRNLPETLVHERVHVLQRLHPEIFRDLIAIREWGMTQIPLREFEPKKALEFRRSNPDLDGFVYASRGEGGVIPITLFDSEESAFRGGLNAATTRLFKDGVEVDRNRGDAEEHPYETQAYMIAQNLFSAAYAKA
jgi:hypothetical protein